jgi:hypothetical protein
MSNNESKNLVTSSLDDAEHISQAIMSLHLKMAWHVSQKAKCQGIISYFRDPPQKWHFHDKLDRVYRALSNEYHRVLSKDWRPHDDLHNRMETIDSTLRIIEEATSTATNSGLWTFDAVRLLNALME